MREWKESGVSKGTKRRTSLDAENAIKSPVEQRAEELHVFLVRTPVTRTTKVVKTYQRCNPVKVP